jgi:hypothetical protein
VGIGVSSRLVPTNIQQVGIGVSSRLVPTNIKQRDWCLLLSWCLAVGIGVSSRLVSMKICKSRLVPTRICTSGDWCLSRLVPTNICNSGLVPTNYKEKFLWFSPERVSM